MSHHLQHVAIALFVRHPVPGRVKTRLACMIGDADASELYRAMVADILVSIKSCDLSLYLFHDGEDATGLPIEWVDAAADVIRQEGISLGDRMAAAFAGLFSIGLEQVVLVGSDIPGIDPELLRSALAAIDEADVVISPAFDGGYCLVAATKDRYNNVIFRDIPWSSATVLAATLAACKSEGLTHTLLNPRQDIDTLDDIKAYCRHPSPYATSTNNWLVSHGYLGTPCSPVCNNLIPA